jgi:hypothetical protein
MYHQKGTDQQRINEYTKFVINNKKIPKIMNLIVT